MVTDEEVNEIIKKLEKIEREVAYIKNHMIDIDMIFTNSERKDFESSLQEYREGRIHTLADLEVD